MRGRRLITLSGPQNGARGRLVWPASTRTSAARAFSRDHPPVSEPKSARVCGSTFRRVKCSVCLGALACGPSIRAVAQGIRAGAPGIRAARRASALARRQIESMRLCVSACVGRDYLTTLLVCSHARVVTRLMWLHSRVVTPYTPFTLSCGYTSSVVTLSCGYPPQPQLHTYTCVVTGLPSSTSTHRNAGVGALACCYR